MQSSVILRSASARWRAQATQGRFIERLSITYISKVWSQFIALSRARKECMADFVQESHAAERRISDTKIRRDHTAPISEQSLTVSATETRLSSASAKPTAIAPHFDHGHRYICACHGASKCKWKSTLVNPCDGFVARAILFSENDH